MSSEDESLRAAVAAAEGELAAVEAAAQEAAERRRRAVAMQVEPLADEVRVLLERKDRLEQDARDPEPSGHGPGSTLAGFTRTGPLPALTGLSLGAVLSELGLRWLREPAVGQNVAVTVVVAGVIALAAWLLVRRSAHG